MLGNTNIMQIAKKTIKISSNKRIVRKIQANKILQKVYNFQN